jgi:hypothetical protein
MCRQLDSIVYHGSRHAFLDAVAKKLHDADITGDFLFRATEEEHLWKIFEYGTDRAGFLGKKPWCHSTGDNPILHEDVIIAASRQALLESNSASSLPTLFNNFYLYDKPVLLVYEKAFFRHLRDHHYLFLHKNNRKQSVLAIIPVISKVKPLAERKSK